MKIIKESVFLILIFLSFTLASCSKEDVSLTPELLIYCGETMALPMQEIANIIEEQENCKITFLLDGSKNLLDIIDVNKVGDLFLPGSPSYLDAADEKGYVTSIILVGQNIPALIVPKGNPKEISKSLEVLIDPQLKIVVGSSESGSIGLETKKILESKNIYNKVLGNVLYLTTDSKDITKAVVSGEADVGINWKATAFWPENRDFISALEFEDISISPEGIKLGLLEFSKFPEYARLFINFTISSKGQEIFKKYGF